MHNNGVRAGAGSILTLRTFAAHPEAVTGGERLYIKSLSHSCLN